MKVYQKIAMKLAAIENCRKSDNIEWEARHQEALDELVKEHMPSGSGFDSGTTLDDERSTSERLVFNTSFHHMSEHGYYTLWTDHAVIVTPSLVHGFDVRITGRDHNDIKECIGDAFADALGRDID